MDHPFLENRLNDRGYRLARTNVTGTKLFYRYTENQTFLVLCLALPEGAAVAPEKLKDIIRAWSDHFIRERGLPVYLLILLETGDVARERASLRDMKNIWYIDSSNNQVIVFEDTPVSFDGLYETVCDGLAAETNRELRRIERRRPYARAREAFSALVKRCPANLVLIGINIAVFLVLTVMGSTYDTEFMRAHGAMYAPDVIEKSLYYEIFTSMFLHFGLQHIVDNMLVLFILGDKLEKIVGSWRFLVIYLLSGLCGNILSFIMQSRSVSPAVSAGASGAIFGVIGAMLYIVIRNKGRIEDVGAVQLLLMLGVSIFHGLMSIGIDNAAHIGGAASGFILAVILYHKKRGMGERPDQSRPDFDGQTGYRINR